MTIPAPACIHSATQTHFIAGPLANIAQKIPTLGFPSLLFNTIIVTRKVFAIHELRYQPAKAQA